MARGTYRAWMTQEGVNDPIVFKLYENTLPGGNPVITYIGEGRCAFALDNGFGEDAFVLACIINDQIGARTLEVLPVGTSETRIYIYDAITGLPADTYQFMIEVSSYHPEP